MARKAQRKIQHKTGLRVSLVVGPVDGSAFKTPEQMMQVIAVALDMSPACYMMRSRSREIVELRFIAAMLIRMHLPYVTLQQIASLFGGQDHSSIISGLTRAYNLIHTGDLRFVKKYNTACRAVNNWMEKINNLAA
jgi:Bacterial dnaA protein helix-turn-helix